MKKRFKVLVLDEQYRPVVEGWSEEVSIKEEKNEEDFMYDPYGWKTITSAPPPSHSISAVFMEDPFNGGYQFKVYNYEESS